MKGKTITKILIILILVTVAGLYLKSLLGGVTASAVLVGEYSYTKAVCDETNFCQDYQIFCDNNIFLKVEKIENASFQYPEDWVDPRSPEAINRLC